MTSILSRLLAVPGDLYLGIITYVPGSAGVVLRRAFWRRRLRYMGKQVRIDVGVYIQNPAYISIDDNCWIDRYVMIMAGPDDSDREKIVRANERFAGEPGTVHIGKNAHISVGSLISGIGGGVHIADDCGIAAGSKIYSFSHNHRSKRDPSDRRIAMTTMVPAARQCLVQGAVYIGENATLALHVVVLPGTVIERDSLVTINSVVGGSHPENSILSGNPATRVKPRFDEQA